MFYRCVKGRCGAFGSGLQVFGADVEGGALRGDAVTGGQFGVAEASAVGLGLSLCAEAEGLCLAASVALAGLGSREAAFKVTGPGILCRDGFAGHLGGTGVAGAIAGTVGGVE